MANIPSTAYLDPRWFSTGPEKVLFIKKWSDSNTYFCIQCKIQQNFTHLCHRCLPGPRRQICVNIVNNLPPAMKRSNAIWLKCFYIFHFLMISPLLPVLLYCSTQVSAIQAIRHRESFQSSNSLPTANHIKESLPAAARRVGVQSARWIKPLEMHVIRVIKLKWNISRIFQTCTFPSFPRGLWGRPRPAAHPHTRSLWFLSMGWIGNVLGLF